MKYPDQFLGRYYTAQQIAEAEYLDHLLDNDSWMLLRLKDGDLAVVVSVDYEDALKEVEG